MSIICNKLDNVQIMTKNIMERMDKVGKPQPMSQALVHHEVQPNFEDANWIQRNQNQTYVNHNPSSSNNSFANPHVQNQSRVPYFPNTQAQFQPPNQSNTNGQLQDMFTNLLAQQKLMMQKMEERLEQKFKLTHQSPLPSQSVPNPNSKLVDRLIPFEMPYKYLYHSTGARLISPPCSFPPAISPLSDTSVGDPSSVTALRSSPSKSARSSLSPLSSSISAVLRHLCLWHSRPC